MTTRWGLDLDMSAVRLMRLSDGTWVEESVEKIDSPDIEERLQAMLADIEPGTAVELFLPRDQILYTDVDLGPGDPKPQIERALDGRTPYALDELSYDWELSGPGKAQVAAIALDTLDEAAAFAEVRGLAIAGYSSLADGADFPRLPRFDGPSITPEPEPEPAPPPEAADDAENEAPSFASARKPSRPPGSEVAAAAAAVKSRITPVEPPAAEAAAPEPDDPEPRPESKPVVEVDDPTPVMNVKPPNMPLDPGIPISAPNAPPRVRTDIAAASVSGTASTLTPPASVRLRNRATPRIGIAAVFAVAFLVTIGVAVLVWNLLPMRPGTTTITPPTAESSEGPSQDSSLAEDATVTEDVAALPDPAAPDSEAAPPAEVAAESPEPEPEPVEIAEPEPEPGPAPTLQASVPEIAAPAEGDAPEIISAAVPEIAARSAPRKLVRALRDGAGLPAYDPRVPNEPTPPALAATMTAPPYPGPDPETEAGVDDIHIASFEPANLGFDAIALPDPLNLRADPVPVLDAGTPAPNAGVDPGAIAEALNDALVGPGGLIQTDLASALPDTAPPARPSDVREEIERLRFGGLTRDELESRRPNARPQSAQTLAADEEPAPASDLAVDTSLTPRGRPGDFDQTVAQARALIAADNVTASASYAAPDTSSAVTAALEADAEPEARPETPRRLNLPTTASVARQATFEDAIILNRVNLVGVYGTPSDRRALVRLENGRYVKVKVGDRVDGGTVARITDDTLLYRKGNRMVALEIPQG